MADVPQDDRRVAVAGPEQAHTVPEHAPAGHDYWRRTRRLGVVVALLWIAFALLVPLAAPALTAISIMGLPLSYYMGAHGILIALAMLALIFAHRQRRIDNRAADAARLRLRARDHGHDHAQDTARPWARPGGVPGMTGALAMAGDWFSGAMLVGLAGALYSLGHDGLAWLVGLYAGVALGGMLIGPHLHRSGSAGMIDFLGTRFGRVAGGLALLLAAAAIALLLAANLQALDLALRVLLLDVPWRLEVGITLAAVVFVLAALQAGGGGLMPLQALALVVAAGVLAMAASLSSGSFAPTVFTYGVELQKITSGELALLEKELADPVTLKAFARPFISATMTGSLLLTASLALGMAVMPHVMGRPVTARSYEGARLMPATALVLMLLAVMSLPPLVALGREAVVATVAGGSVDQVPAAVLALGARGLVNICGVAAVSQDAVSAACAALSDAPTALRLDDIAIARDHVLFALPALAGLPAFATPLLAAVVALTALLAVAWLGASAGTMAAAGRQPSVGQRVGRMLVAALAAALAIMLVATRTADVMTLIAWAMALAAAGLAPALLSGLWWTRANAAAAVVAMLAGAGVTIYYVIATRYFAPAFFELWSHWSSAGFGAIADLKAAHEALQQAADPAARAAAVAAHAESARAVANWLGVRPEAAGVLGAGVGFVLLILVSAVTPRPRGAALGILDHIRKPPGAVSSREAPSDDA